MCETRQQNPHSCTESTQKELRPTRRIPSEDQLDEVRRLPAQRREPHAAGAARGAAQECVLATALRMRGEDDRGLHGNLWSFEVVTASFGFRGERTKGAPSLWRKRVAQDLIT